MQSSLKYSLLHGPSSLPFLVQALRPADPVWYEPEFEVPRRSRSRGVAFGAFFTGHAPAGGCYSFFGPR